MTSVPAIAHRMRYLPGMVTRAGSCRVNDLAATTALQPRPNRFDRQSKVSRCIMRQCREVAQCRGLTIKLTGARRARSEPSRASGHTTIRCRPLCGGGSFVSNGRSWLAWRCHRTRANHRPLSPNTQSRRRRIRFEREVRHHGTQAYDGQRTWLRQRPRDRPTAAGQ